ncbi:MAG: ATP-binding cassette domain-containing protein [Pseudomonadota bacterium]
MRDGAETPVLEVVHLAKTFGAVVATDDVSLDVQAGEIHALIGPNGAGKSTLIKLTTGEIEADVGDVRLHGRSLASRSASARVREGLGRTFQISTLALELTARQNVQLALIGRKGLGFRLFANLRRDRALQDEAQLYLARVGIGDLGDKPAATLAHGQRRLLELAIALALRPVILLLDEPMAGLGEAGSIAVTALLDELRVEVPILLIEHDMDAVFSLADRITVLDYGRVIASGPVEEVRGNKAVQEAYLGGTAT